MGELITEQSWRSIHTDYLRFAILSFRACDESLHEPSYLYVNRHAIDTIRYSYDFIEASVEFIYLMGKGKQLPIDIPDNWLSRWLERKWNNLSVNDKLGMLSFAWTGKAFWQSETQFQLFADLKKIRDGLTHPIPFGLEIELEIMPNEETAKDHVFGARKPTGKYKYLKPDLLVNSRKVASFAQSADALQKNDAEQAVEIMLRHAIRFEDLFFLQRTTWFAFYESVEDRIYTSEEVLQTINCNFDKAWEPKLS